MTFMKKILKIQRKGNTTKVMKVLLSLLESKKALMITLKKMLMKLIGAFLQAGTPKHGREVEGRKCRRRQRLD